MNDNYATVFNQLYRQWKSIIARGHSVYPFSPDYLASPLAAWEVIKNLNKFIVKLNHVQKPYSLKNKTEYDQMVGIKVQATGMWYHLVALHDSAQAYMAHDFKIITGHYQESIENYEQARNHYREAKTYLSEQKKWLEAMERWTSGCIAFISARYQYPSADARNIAILLDKAANHYRSAIELIEDIDPCITQGIKRDLDDAENFKSLEHQYRENLAQQTLEFQEIIEQRTKDILITRQKLIKCEPIYARLKFGELAGVAFFLIMFIFCYLQSFQLSLPSFTGLGNPILPLPLRILFALFITLPIGGIAVTAISRLSTMSATRLFSVFFGEDKLDQLTGSNLEEKLQNFIEEEKRAYHLRMITYRRNIITVWEKIRHSIQNLEKLYLCNKQENNFIEIAAYQECINTIIRENPASLLD